MAGTDASRPLGPALTDRLDATRFSVDWVPTTGSTNADLLAAAGSGAPDGTVLGTEHQSAGRGRRGRTWEAPAGASLLMSVLLRPDMAPGRTALLTAALGLAARQACRSVTGVEPGLKWPNDLVCATGAGERKLGGILAESRVVGDRVEAVVLGIGLNVNWPETVPDELTGIAVALNHLRPGAAEVDRADLVVSLLTDLDGRLASIEAGDDQSVWDAWRQASATLGREVRIETAGEPITGRAVDVTNKGRLVLVCSDGSRIEIDVGDVVHLRSR